MKQPENTSQQKQKQEKKEKQFDPKEMEAIAKQLIAEGKMPTLEELNETIQKYRPGYQKRLKELREKG